MPYASKAQERFFHSEGAKKAGITNKQVNEFDKASKGLKLPERVGEKVNHHHHGGRQNEKRK